jgi:DNA-binding NarL/FixJ family response regulator
MTQPLRVALVEDHALIRTGLRTSLRSIGYDVVAEASDGIAALGQIEQARPDLCIVDLGLPGKDGAALTRDIKALPFATRVVVLTMNDNEPAVVAAIEAGAEGYCLKSSGLETIVDAIRTVAAGGAFFDPMIAALVLRRLAPGGPSSGDSPLTPRETEILGLIAQGVSNNHIAEQLYVSLGTVKAHIGEILKKLQATDRAHAAAIGLRSGYIR